MLVNRGAGSGALATIQESIESLRQLMGGKFLSVCTNCSIILSVKELNGSESCTQLALQYLELTNSLKGFFYILNAI